MEMKRYNLRLSVLSLSTLVIVVLYTPKSSEAYYYPGYGGANAFSSMGDVDWSKRSWPGYGGANAYSSMGDVDWSKRSVGAARQFGDGEDHEKVKKAGGLYRNWLSGGYKPGANAYFTMGDADWSKRSIGTARQFGDGEDNENTRMKRIAGGMYRSWLSAGKRPGSWLSAGKRPYEFHSMADGDWGWRKRAEMSAEDDHEAPAGLYKNFLMKKGRGYKHRPNYGYRPRKYWNQRNYFSSPYTMSVTARRAPSIKRPRASSYHSMADMDWGWKRKKRTGLDLFGNNADFSDNDPISDEELNDLMQMLYQNSEDDTDDLDVSKRNIGSVLTKGNDKRTIASLARNNDFFVDGKENYDVDKKNVAALARNSRNVGSLLKAKPASPDAGPGTE